MPQKIEIIGSQKASGIEIILPGGSKGVAYDQGKGPTLGLQNSSTQEVVPDFSSYDNGYLQAHGSRNAFRERNQSAFEMWRNSLVQSAGELAFGLGEGVGYLADLEQWGNIIQGTEEEYANWFSDLMKKGKEATAEAAPIFQTNEALEAGFAPADPTWWAANMPSITSALSLLIPTRGVVKGIGWVLGAASKGLGKAGIMAPKALRTLMRSEKGMRTVEGLGSAMVSRYMENTMEASGAYEQTYNAAIEAGDDEETAKLKAGEAASTTWYGNLVNLMTDFAQYSTILKAGSKGAGKLAFDYVKNMAGEAVEEAEQSIISSEAVNAALNQYDPFGAGFSNRLSDYLSDPELHTSAVFGAFGGGVFEAVGMREKYKENITRAKKEQDLAIERAAAVGDKAKVQSIKDTAFSELAFKHLATGTMEQLQADLEDLQRTKDLDEDTKKHIDTMLKNTEFLETQYGKLIDDTTVPKEAIFPMLSAQLEIKNKSTQLSSIQNAQNQLFNEIQQRNEVDPGFLQAKKDYHMLKAYETLGKAANVDFSAEINHLEDQFLLALKQHNTTGIGTGTRDPFLTKLVSSNDPQIQDNYNKIVALQQQIERARKDLGAISTPEGLASLKAAKTEKNANKEAEAILNDTASKLPDLQKAEKMATDPALKAKIADTIKKTKAATKSENTEKIKETVKQEKAKVKEEVKEKPKAKKQAKKQAKPFKVNEEAIFDESQLDEVLGEPDFDYEPDFEQDFEQDFEGAAEPPENAVIDPKEEQELILKYPLILKQPVTSRIETETSKPAAKQTKTVAKKQAEKETVKRSVQENTANTVLKEIAGSYQMVKVNIDGVEQEMRMFVVDQNPDSSVKKQLYYRVADTGKRNPLTPDQVYDSQDVILTVNTPNVNIGDRVVIVVEPNYEFWSNPNWYSVAMNVYKVDDKGQPVGKPLTQIPATFRPDGKTITDTSTVESNTLRKKVWENWVKNKKPTYTTVVYKNYGDLIHLRNPDKTRKQNSLSVLETDMVRGRDGVWRVEKTAHNPIIGYIDPQVNLEIPKISLMKGVDVATANDAMSAKIVNPAPGTVVALRRMGTGKFVIAQIDPRRLNEEEAQWVLTNLPQYLSQKRLRELKNVIHLENSDFNDDITEKKEHHLVVLGDDIAFKAKLPGNENPQWVKINAAGRFGENFQNFMDEVDFIYQVYNEETKDYDTYNTAQQTAGTIEALKKQFESIVKTSFKNVNKDFLNSEQDYVDIVTGITYPTYYDYLKATNTITTDLPEGYSIFNATIYLDPNAEETSVVNPITKEVEKTAKPTPTLAPKPAEPEVKTVEEAEKPKEEKPKEEPKKSTDWRKDAEENLDQFFRISRTTGTYNVIGEQEWEWLKAKFPDNYLSIAESVDRVMSDGGVYAFGYFHNAMITLAQFAEEGTAYHEAFHFVFNTQLSKKQRERILKEAGKNKGQDNRKINYESFDLNDKRNKIPTSEIFKLPMETKRVAPQGNFTGFYETLVPVSKIAPSQETINSKYTSSGMDYIPSASQIGDKFVLNDGHHRVAGQIAKGQKYVLLNVKYEEGSVAHQRAIEERLAEEFREFMLSGGSTPAKTESAKSFFKKLLDYILHALGFKTSIERLFKDIASFKMTPEAEANVRNYIKEVGTDEEIEKFRLIPGFRSLAQQTQSLDAITHMLIQKALLDAKEGDYDVLLSNPKNVETYLEAIRKDLQESLDALVESFKTPKENPTKEEQAELLKLKVRALSIETVLKNWEDVQDELNITLGVKSKVIQNMNNYGFSVKTNVVSKDILKKDEDIEEDDEVSTPSEPEEEEAAEAYVDDPTAKERIHGTSFLLSSPLKTLSAKVKKFLSTIPEYDKTGKPVETIFGTPKFLPFNKVYGNLKAKLAGTKHIFSKLAELAEKDPVIKAIKDQLDIHLVQAGARQDQLPAQFYTAFNNSPYRFFTTMITKEEGQEIIKIIETDRRGIERTIISDWEEQAAENGLINLQDGKAKSKWGEIKRDLGRLAVHFNNRKNPPPYETLLTYTKAMFEKIGVTLPEQAWEDVKKHRNPSKRLKDLLFGESSSSLETAVNKAVGKNNINPFDAEGVFKVLANMAKPYVDDIQAKTFINEKGNQVSAINLNTYLSDKVQELTDPETGLEAIAKLEQDPFMRENRFLNILRDSKTRDTVTVNVFSAFKESASAEAKEYTDTTAQDSFVSRLIAYAAGENNTVGYYYLGTLSDKSQQIAIKLPREGTPQALATLRRTLRNTVNQEIARIQRINKKLNAVNTPGLSVDQIANYGKRGRQFLYIPEMNAIPNLADSLLEGELTPEQVAAFEPQIQEIIEKYIEKEYNLFIKKLNELAIIKGEGSDMTNVKINGKSVLPETFSAGLENKMKEFFYNDFSWRIDLSKVFHGDLAFYKNDADYFKRGYQVITPGLQGYYNSELKSAGQKESYSRAIFKTSLKSNSDEYILDLATLIDPTVKSLSDDKPAVRIAKAYGYSKDPNSKIKKTDGQAYCTIETFRDIMMSLGQWREDHETFYQEAWKGGYSIKSKIKQTEKEGQFTKEEIDHLYTLEAELLLQPLKPFAFSDRMIELEDGSFMNLKEQYKESITPLLPEWAEKHTEFNKLYKAMKANNVDIISDEGAVKVGQYGVSDDLTKPIITRNIPVSAIRYPFIVPAHSKKEILAGTQIEKLILGNINPETSYTLPDGTSMKGGELIEHYHSIWARKIENDYERLKTKLKVDENFEPVDRKDFMINLKNILVEEIRNRDLPENYTDALQLILNKMEQPEFLLSLDFPALGAKYEQVLANLFKKAILTQKLPGDALINVADYGISEAKDSSELKFIQNKDGQIVEAEVGVPERFLKKLGIKLNKETVGANGKLIWEKLTPEQQKGLQLIVYRIPTQGKNSMLPVRVAFVFPDSAGSAIMLPGEMTVQGGMDFDVDKSYIMKREIGKKGQIKESANNALFDVHWAVLTSQAHAYELLNPLDSVIHDEVIKELEKKGVVQRNAASSPFNTATDLEQEKLAKYSKSMIGTFSKYAVGHATLQAIPSSMIRVDVPINIENSNYSYDSLGKQRDDIGNMISDNHSAQQNSALDAQKDPKLGYLNITTFNAAVLGYMTDLGVNQRLALYFMNQPVLRSLADNYFKIGDNNLNSAIRATLDQYPGLAAKYQEAKDISVAQITADNIDASLTIPVVSNLEHQGQILADFQKYYFAAKDMNKVNTALSTDTARDFSSIAAVESFASIISYVTNPNKSKVSLSYSIFDINKSPVKRVAAFYRYGIEAATKFTNKFYPYSSTIYRNVREQIARDTLQKDLVITDKDDINTINRAILFYSLGEHGALNKKLELISPNYTKRWGYSTTAPTTFGSYLQAMKRTHKEINDNLLVQAIRRDNISRKATIAMVGINNTHGNYNKTNLTMAWESMLNSSNKEVRQFAQDLVRFAIETSGFRTSPIGLIDVVPATFWKESGIADTIAEITRGYATDAKNSNTADISKVVIRHIFSSSSFVKAVKINVDKEGRINSGEDVENVKVVDGAVESFNVVAENSVLVKDPKRITERWARFARVYDAKKGLWRLYEQSKSDPTLYQQIQPLGDVNFVEFTTNPDAESKIPGRKTIPPAHSYGSNDITGDPKPVEGMEKHYASVGLDKRIQRAEVVLDKLKAVITDKKQSEFLDKMIANVEKVGGVKIVVEENLTDDEGNHVPGMYDPLRNEIYVSNKAATPEGLHHILLHELQHAFGLRAYYQPTTALEQQFKESVDRVYAEAKSKLTKDDYASESPAEFIAELASLPSLRKKLRGKLSTWQKIIRMFRRLFGLNDSYDALIEQFYDVMDAAETLVFVSNDRFFLKKEEAKDSAIVDPMLNKLMKLVIKSFEKARNRMSRQNKDTTQIEKEIEALSSLTDKAALISYIQATNKKAAELQKEFDALMKEPDKVKASKIRGIKEQLEAAKIVQRIRDYVAAHPDQYKDLNRGERTFIGGIDKTLGTLRTLDNRIYDASIDLVANWVKKTTSEELPIEDIKAQLRVAERDITIINRGLDAIVDSRDPVLRSIGKEVIDAKARAFRKAERLLKERWLKVNENYEAWLKQQGIDPTNLREKNKFIIDPKSFHKDSKGIMLIQEDSNEGKAILKRKDGDPLKEYYKMVVYTYIELQKNIPIAMRPGYRIPSIRRTTWEALGEEKGLDKLRSIKEAFVDQFRLNYDETDFQATDEAGNPIDYLPVRFISKQDGKDGRMSTREVSLDIGSTVFMFITEMYNHDEMQGIMHDLELAKDILEKREVAKTKRKAGFEGLLDEGRIAQYDADGNLITTAGSDSNSFKMAEQFMRRFVYGHVKEHEGDFTIFGFKFDKAKTFDALLKYTGIRMMAANLNVAFSNVATGEATMLKEAIGGRYFTMKDWLYSKRKYGKDIWAYLSEAGKRRTDSKLGAVYEYFNPEDSQHNLRNFSKESNRVKKLVGFDLLNVPNKIGTNELNMTAMLAVMNKYKFTSPDGKRVGLYDALEIKNGIPVIKEGYKSEKPFNIDQVRSRVIAVSQKMNGIYNAIDSPGIKAYSIGRMAMLMRNWLKPGIDARWKLKHYNERMQATDEGYYITAMKFFRTMYGPNGVMQGTVDLLRYMTFMGVNDPKKLLSEEELQLSEEKQADLIDLRKANLRKFIFEAYLIAAISALAMFGWDDDEKDSFVLYQLVRLKRELLTFASPTEAWSVIRNPTVMLDSIQRLTQFTYSVTVGMTTGEAWEEYEQGPNKGEVKWKARLFNQLPIVGMRNQFVEFDRRIDLIERGWK